MDAPCLEFGMLHHRKKEAESRNECKARCFNTRLLDLKERSTYKWHIQLDLLSAVLNGVRSQYSNEATDWTTEELRFG